MKVVVFDTHRFERPIFEEKTWLTGTNSLFLEARLTEETAGAARGYEAVCAFANDCLNARVLERLAAGGTRFVALRSAGFNHVDLPAAAAAGIRVARVPAYSPHAVAEHAVALLLALNRKLCRAHARVHELNFSLDGLVGFDLHGKTVGVVGTGKIGSVFARILLGFGCRVLAFDPSPDPALEAAGVRYLPFEEVCAQSRVLSLHVPLTAQTRHLLNEAAFRRLPRGAMVINTGRGALIDTAALIRALKSGQVGAAALDVYEEEESLFFHDHSGEVLQDDTLARLLTFPNVLITAHQAFLTQEALDQIVSTTLENLTAFARRPQPEQVGAPTAAVPPPWRKRGSGRESGFVGAKIGPADAMVGRREWAYEGLGGEAE